MVKWLKVFLFSFALALIPAVFTFSLASDLLTIKRVIDGDTLLLGNGERVRLIGVLVIGLCYSRRILILTFLKAKLPPKWLSNRTVFSFLAEFLNFGSLDVHPIEISCSAKT